MKLDIEENRKFANYSTLEYILRILWDLFSPLFYLSPRNFFFWRSFLLRIFGAHIGKNVHIYPSAKIYLPWKLSVGDYSSIGEWTLIYNLGPVIIGNSVTISHLSHLCAGTHQYNISSLPLQKLPIVIKDNVWLCTEAFIGPNCTIGEGTVVGARSVVLKSLDDWLVVGGNPARIIKKRIIN